MKADSNRAARIKKGAVFFVLGCIMFSPLSVVVARAEIFYTQQLTVFIFGVYFVLFQRTTRSKNGGQFDKLIASYFAWILCSYAVNVVLSISSWNSDIEIRRIFSLFMTCCYLMGYLVGRRLEWGDGYNIGRFTRGLMVTFALLDCYYLWCYFDAGLADLYHAREIVGQRVPFILCYMVILCATLCVFWKAWRWRLLFLASIGLTIVGVSLTRAAYIQCAVSALILLLYFSMTKPLRTIGVLFVIAIVCVVVGRLIPDDQRANFTTITDRFAQIGHISDEVNVDASGNYRIAMWKAILTRMSSNPIHWLAGFGQLGSSFVVEEFEFNQGTATGASAHSQYMDVLIREGIVGLLLFLFIYYKVVAVGFFESCLIVKPYCPFIIANSTALAGVFFYGFFHETVRYPMFGFFFWLYVGFLSSVVRKAKHQLSKGSVSVQLPSVSSA